MLLVSISPLIVQTGIDDFARRFWPDPAPAPNEWIIVFKVASRLRFNDFMVRAMEQLEYSEGMIGFPRMICGILANSPQWLLKGACELSVRPAALDLEESKVLGMELSVKINDARNYWHLHEYRGKHDYSFGTPPKKSLQKYVQRLLNVDDGQIWSRKQYIIKYF